MTFAKTTPKKIFTKMDDEIDFGKYKGHTLRYILKFDPEYLEWCVDTTDRFALSVDDMDEIERLSSEEKTDTYDDFEDLYHFYDDD